jgi:hypothetical protein
MKNNNKKANWPFIISWIDLVFRTLSISVVYFLVATYFYNNADFTENQKIILICFFYIPVVFYFINILTFFKRIHVDLSHARVGKRNNYHLRNKHFTGYIAIIILYSSLLAGMVIFNAKPPILLIPDMKSGTFGIRAWRSCVAVNLLSAAYLDENRHWRKIPDSVLFDKKNWMYPLMYENPKADAKTLGYGVTFHNYIHTIVLNNCAAVFYPPENIHKKVFHDIRIKAKIIYLSVDKDEEVYPGFQFITFIDTIVDPMDTNNDGKKESKFSELDLQFNLNFYDKPIPWIPDLDWLPSILNRSPKKDLKKYGGFEVPLKRNKWYDISAIVYDDQVLFLGHDYGTCTLFESRINSPTDKNR